MAQASAYNEKYHDDWAWSLSVKGATDEEMAEAFGISVRTLHRWKNKGDDKAHRPGHNGYHVLAQ